ncbi:MAG: hypothetical protein A2X78_01655 [Gammaproteobacteria bacterium GWE2_37_16]|nr:MAG: hypothetical protein A2X78_01655 [Gammaproteobacteria bacterium GWE2_37_16]
MLRKDIWFKFKNIGTTVFAVLLLFICCGKALAANTTPTPTTTTKPTAAVASSFGQISTSAPTQIHSAFSSMQTLIPAAPDLNVKAYILVDAKSGNVIAAKNPDDHLPPASMTKIMSIYLVADALRSGKIKFTDQVPISENAWRTGGSRMFAKVGSTIPVQQLIDGIIIASGNDATVAMAEFLAGTEASFADLMNQTAAVLGMKDSHFVDSNGLPAPNHYSSARNMAILARAWIYNFPEYYPWFKTKWIMYNNIKQPNRNRLLWRDPSVDGMKTGHTNEAGYCLTASAERNGMRLITVVMGAPSEKDRANYSEALLNYGFRFFESHKIYAANTPVLNAKVWYGTEKALPLGVAEDFYITTPVGQNKNLKIKAILNGKVVAPVGKNQALGTITVSNGDKVIVTKPLVALKEIPVGGFWSRIWDKIREAI